MPNFFSLGKNNPDCSSEHAIGILSTYRYDHILSYFGVYYQFPQSFLGMVNLSGADKCSFIVSRMKYDWDLGVSELGKSDQIFGYGKFNATCDFSFNFLQKCPSFQTRSDNKPDFLSVIWLNFDNFWWFLFNNDPNNCIYGLDGQMKKKIVSFKESRY